MNRLITFFIVVTIYGCGGWTVPYIDPSWIPSVTFTPAPLEVFFFDWDIRPPDKGNNATTYTAQVFIADNRAKKLHGPWRASTYPNSFSSTDNTTPYNTVKGSGHLFNNLNGHDGSTRKGINLVDYQATRKSPAYHMNNPDTTAWHINVHKGYSNNGNYNSRGSQGCITIHPDDHNKFFNHFDFSGKGGTTGRSTGIVYIFREKANTRRQMIADLQNQYP